MLKSQASEISSIIALTPNFSRAGGLKCFASIEQRLSPSPNNHPPLPIAHHPSPYFLSCSSLNDTHPWLGYLHPKGKCGDSGSSDPSWALQCRRWPEAVPRLLVLTCTAHGHFSVRWLLSMGRAHYRVKTASTNCTTSSQAHPGVRVNLENRGIIHPFVSCPSGMLEKLRHVTPGPSFASNACWKYKIQERCFFSL